MPRSRSKPEPITVKSIAQRVYKFPGDLLRRYMKLSVKGKTAVWAIAAVNLGLLIAILIITPTRIGGWFNAFAIKIRGLGPWGVILCSLFTILASHPPFFGFAGSLTLIGFTYGIWPGFLIAIIASQIGAGIAFLSVRAFFLSFMRKRSNDKWAAFGHVMAAKGLPLVIMIRYCPIPWAIGNGLFASIESVKFWQFMLATLLIQPRLLIPVFIGSRLPSLTSETPTHDPLRFWLNLGSILLSSTISLLTGIWIYRLTLEQMRKLEEEGELAAEALEEGELLGDWSGEDGDGDGDEGGDDEPLRLGGTGRRSLRPGGAVRRVSSGETR